MDYTWLPNRKVQRGGRIFLGTTHDSIDRVSPQIVESPTTRSGKRTHAVATEEIENASTRQRIECNWSTLPIELWAIIAQHLDHEATTLLSRTSQQFRNWFSIHQLKEADSLESWQGILKDSSLLRKPNVDEVLKVAYLGALLKTRNQEKHVDDPLSVFSEYSPDALLARYVKPSSSLHPKEARNEQRNVKWFTPQRAYEELETWRKGLLEAGHTLSHVNQMTALSYLLADGHDSDSTLKFALPQMRSLITSLMMDYYEAQDREVKAANGDNWVFGQWIALTSSAFFRQDPNTAISPFQLLQEGFILPLAKGQCLDLLAEACALIRDDQTAETPKPENLVILRLSATRPNYVITMERNVASGELTTGVVKPKYWNAVREGLAQNSLFIKFRPDVLLPTQTPQVDVEWVRRRVDCLVVPSVVLSLSSKEERITAFTEACEAYQQVFCAGVNRK